MNLEFHPLVIERDWGFIVDQVPVNLCQDTKGIIAVDLDQQKIVGACVMDNWTWNAVQVHMYLESPFIIRHGFFEEIANYIFYDCNRSIMIGLVPGDNAAALKLNKHIGFREVHRIVDGCKNGVDYVIMEAREDDLSRWLEAA